MPADVSRTFSISVSSGTAGRMHLVLSGDVDLAARPQLTHAVAQVAAAAPRTVVVDLAAVTFAGSALVNFLAGVRLGVPDGAVLLACRPTPAVNWVLTASDGADIAIVRREMCA